MFDRQLATQMEAMGRVRHIVSPNQFHYAHIGEWSRAFPAAVTWASPRVRRRAKARHVDVRFDRDLDDSPPDAWRSELDQARFPGGYSGEFIFFHYASRSLILADTIFNLELEKIDQPWRQIVRLTRMASPEGRTFFGMRLTALLQKQQAELVTNKIKAWQPRQVLLSHGRCFEADADDVIRRMFG